MLLERFLPGGKSRSCRLPLHSSFCSTVCRLCGCCCDGAPHPRVQQIVLGPRLTVGAWTNAEGARSGGNQSDSSSDSDPLDFGTSSDGDSGSSGSESSGSEVGFLESDPDTPSGAGSEVASDPGAGSESEAGAGDSDGPERAPSGDSSDVQPVGEADGESSDSGGSGRQPDASSEEDGEPAKLLPARKGVTAGDAPGNSSAADIRALGKLKGITERPLLVSGITPWTGGLKWHVHLKHARKHNFSLRKQAPSRSERASGCEATCAALRAGTYVPPALRGEGGGSAAGSDGRAAQQVRGLLNRLAESNMPGIASQASCCVAPPATLLPVQARAGVLHVRLSMHANHAEASSFPRPSTVSVWLRA